MHSSKNIILIGALVVLIASCKTQSEDGPRPKAAPSGESREPPVNPTKPATKVEPPLPPIPLMGDTAHPPIQRGVALGLYSEDPEWSYVDLLTEIKSSGASHVSIAVPWYMKTAGDSEIFKHPRFTVPMRTVKRTINDARKLGLEVFLFPILRVEDKSDGGWRGTLHPKDEDAFYANYIKYILKFARLAEELEVPLLSIGSELSSLDVNTEKWTLIARRVRSVYSGKLTYSANWDHYTEVHFFGDLDYAGVTGYFELASPGDNPDVSSLVRAWQRVKRDLMAWQQTTRKPLILTEVGYLSQKNAPAWPWKEGADEALDLEIQRRCYEAVRRVWNGEKNLAGLYFWNWFGWGGPTSKEYSPRNKPAAREVEKWYRQATKKLKGPSHDRTP